MPGALAATHCAARHDAATRLISNVGYILVPKISRFSLPNYGNCANLHMSLS